MKGNSDDYLGDRRRRLPRESNRKKLVAQGRNVRALVRKRAKAKIRLGAIADRIEIVEGDVTQPATLAPAMRDVSAVIHYVAIAMEKGGQTYEAVNYQGTVNVLRGGRISRRQALYQYEPKWRPQPICPIAFSPVRVAPRNSSPSQICSGQRCAHPRYSVRKTNSSTPSPACSKSRRLIFPLIGGGKAEFQPVSVYDVVEAVIRCLDDDSTIGAELALGGPESTHPRRD